MSLHSASHFNFRLEKSIKFKLVNIVKGIPDFLVTEKRQSRDILIQDHEKLFSLISFDYVLDNVVRILKIYFYHLDGLSFVRNFFSNSLLYSFSKVSDPDVL